MLLYNSFEKVLIIKNYSEPVIFEHNENVYLPSDDTYLIIDYFKDNIDDQYFDGIRLEKIQKLLDLGTGTGIIALFLQMIKNCLPKFNPMIYASDILKEAIKSAKKNQQNNKIEGKINFIQSNLFDSFPPSLKESFNIIIFNPPYLPSFQPNEKSINKLRASDITWDGGKKGIEILTRFIKQVKNFLILKKESYIYYICSDKADLKQLYEFIYHEGFKNTILAKKHLFFEDIFLNRIEYNIG
ncbi:MAG: HemK2/MTQ2 family protein methyltransferase [Promethearchaeota archaeon]